MFDKTGIAILKTFAVVILMLALWYAGYIVGSTDIASIAPREAGVGCDIGDDIQQKPAPYDLPTIKEI